MRTEFQDRTLMAFRTGAIVVAFLAGFYALAALVVGSPLEFGVALALCGACWVAADFIEWAAERERSAGKWSMRAALLDSGYGSSYPLRVDVNGHFSRTPRPHPTRPGAPLRRNFGRQVWSWSYFPSNC
jgi:hypothetical protein